MVQSGRWSKEGSAAVQLSKGQGYTAARKGSSKCDSAQFMRSCSKRKSATSIMKCSTVALTCANNVPAWRGLYTVCTQLYVFIRRGLGNGERAYVCGSTSTYLSCNGWCMFLKFPSKVRLVVCVCGAEVLLRTETVNCMYIGGDGVFVQVP